MISNFYTWLFGSAKCVAMDEERKVYRHHPDGSPCYAEKEEDCPIIAHGKKAEEADDIEQSQSVEHQEEKPSLVTPEEDAAYLEAVNKGDNETALRMIRDVAARAMPNTKIVSDDGLPKKVYHGTKSDFTVFDIKKVGSAFPDVDADHNFFFTASYDRAAGYGRFVKSVYLNVIDPEIHLINFSGNNFDTSDDGWESLIVAHDVGGSEDKEIISGNQTNSDGGIWKLYSVNENDIQKDKHIVSIIKQIQDNEKQDKKLIIDLQQRRNEISRPYAIQIENIETEITSHKSNITKLTDDFFDCDNQEVRVKLKTEISKAKSTVSNLTNKKIEIQNLIRSVCDNDSQYQYLQKALSQVRENLKRLEDEYHNIYISLVKSFPRTTNESNAIYNCDVPTQIKSSEITYDDNGNIIPLSRRFDMANPDIRY